MADQTSRHVVKVPAHAGDHREVPHQNEQRDDAEVVIVADFERYAPHQGKGGVESAERPVTSDPGDSQRDSYRNPQENHEEQARKSEDADEGWGHLAASLSDPGTKILSPITQANSAEPKATSQ